MAKTNTSIQAPVPQPDESELNSLTNQSAGNLTLEGISIKDIIINLKDWWKFLVSKWLIILILSFFGGVAGFFYAKSLDPIYRADLSFALEDNQSGGGLSGALGLASQFGLDMGGGAGGAFSGDNLIELMKSRSMVEKSLLTSVNIDNKIQTLADYYIRINDLRESWKEKPNLKDVSFPVNLDRSQFSRIQDSILGVFHTDLIKNSLTVSKLDKKLSIITVTVKSIDENFSKYFCDRLVKEVSDFYVETKTKKSVQNLSILQHQVDSVKRMLTSAIGGVASTSDLYPNANMARNVLRVPSQMKQVDVQANQAILIEMVKNLEISKISLRRETPLIQIIDVPRFPLEKKQLGKLKTALIGSIIAGIFSVVVFILIKLYHQIINE
jgi:hypothetical protein